MYCNHCGKNLEPGTVCCPYCGQKAESLSGGTGFWDLTDEPRSQQPAAPQQPMAPQPAAQPAQPVRPAASRPEAPEQKQPNGTQPQAGNNLIAVVAAVLAAGALILGAVNLVQVKKLQKNVGALEAARQTEQSAGENMPEPSAMPTVTPEEVTPAETIAPAVSEEPTPTVTPEMEESAAETTSPAAAPSAVAENQSEFKVELGSEDSKDSKDSTSVAVQQNDKGKLCLYFYANGVDTSRYDILWWKKTNDDAQPVAFLDGDTQSSNVYENIVLTDAQGQEEYSVFFTVYEKGAEEKTAGNALDTSNKIHVLDNKLLTVKVTVEENNNFLSYEGINGFKALMDQYTIVWETYNESKCEWEEAGTNETLTLTGEYENKRIRAAVYSDVNKEEGSLVGYTEYKTGAKN